jgi:hypothetical protein
MRASYTLAMNYCSKCGQGLPNPRFRIVNGPARLLFIWPAVDLIAYATIPRGPDMLPYLHGAALAAGTVFTVAVYAWDRVIGTMTPQPVARMEVCDA